MAEIRKIVVKEVRSGQIVNIFQIYIFKKSFGLSDRLDKEYEETQLVKGNFLFNWKWRLAVS